MTMRNALRTVGSLILLTIAIAVVFALNGIDIVSVIVNNLTYWGI